MNFVKSYICPSCGMEVKIDLEDYIVDVSEYERQMGTEYEHSVECEGTCSNCNHEYLITGSIWEYPVNVENLDDTKFELKD